MFEDTVLERGERVLEGIESPRSVPASHDPSFEPDRQEVTARAPSPQESPAARAPAPPDRAETARPEANGKERRASFLRRRPVVSAIGAVLLASAIAGGYLYMD
jgi:membrane fusion protein (multidrug efflux system)